MKHIPRFYINETLSADRCIGLSDDQAHHLSVLRLREGATVHLFNGSCGEWRAVVESIKKGNVICLEKIFDACDNKENVGPIIACSLISPGKFRFVLEKTTELGVSGIVPIISHYTQNRDFNHQKAEQVIIQACEQSKRINVPKLYNLTKIERFLTNYDYNGNIIVGVEDFSGEKLKNTIEKDCVFLIGPEGGFSKEEYEMFDEYDFVKKATLGYNTLRSETAAVAMVSIWIHEFGF